MQTIKATIRAAAEPTPQVAPQVAALLHKFNMMIDLGLSKNEILQNVLKDELFVLVMFYREKTIHTEGGISPIKNEDLVFESVEVEYV